MIVIIDIVTIDQPTVEFVRVDLISSSIFYLFICPIV